MDKLPLKELIEKYNNGECNDEEISVVETWFLKLPEEVEVPLSKAELDKAVERVAKRLPHLIRGNVRSLWRKLSIAASILALIGTASYYILENKREVSVKPGKLTSLILPGGNKAVLTLANGQKIVLKPRSGNSSLQQTGASISQLPVGKLVYVVNNNKAVSAIAYNSLSTPRGGQYQLQLSDGTKVWLNANSSLKYPTIFQGTTRTVELAGEAYFEVAHNANMPFTVISGDQIIEDLGTNFDVMAYSDLIVRKLTLLEGKVKISTNGNSKILKPGEQAQISYGNIKVIKNVDLEEVISWKNGFFKFSGNSLRDIMSEVARWYDVEIVYSPGTDQSQVFFGTVPRSGNVSILLNIMETTGQVHFKIEGRRIYVKP